jgi:hypothetical protein
MAIFLLCLIIIQWLIVSVQRLKLGLKNFKNFFGKRKGIMAIMPKRKKNANK